MKLQRQALVAQILWISAGLHIVAPDDARRCGLHSLASGSTTPPPFETVPIFLKFHKVGSTAFTAMLQTLCHTNWWNATDTKAQKAREQQQQQERKKQRQQKQIQQQVGSQHLEANNFCCGDPFWHQTIHQYRADGGCSLKACTLGWALGQRSVKLLALFREPSAKFVSGIYYFARWQNKQRLFSAPPSNFTLAEFQKLAHASLEVRMKAPVQEYTVVLSRRVQDFKWGQVADPDTVAVAKANLVKDGIIVGTVERLTSFSVLVALELGWAPRMLPCLDHVNRGKATTATASSSTQTSRMLAADSRAKIDPKDSASTSSKSSSSRGQQNWADLTLEQQGWMTSYNAAEIEVYEFVKQLALQQEHKHSTHASAVASHVATCSLPDPGENRDVDKGVASQQQHKQQQQLPLRISTFKGGARPTMAAGKGDPRWACAVERGR